MSEISAVEGLEDYVDNLSEQKSFTDLLRLFANKASEVQERYQKLSSTTKEGFNVFSCLTRYHLEELHSKFICYLLNPKEAHNCGEIFLKLFLEVINQNESIQFELGDIEEHVLSNATVAREVNVHDGDELYGFIDILIETEKACIVIENKIHAREQPKQIERYVKYCRRKNKAFVCLYLTPYGSFSLESGEEKYFPISYERQIISWLEQCSENMNSYPVVTAGIGFYLNTLKASILKQPSKNIMELKDFLLEKENGLILKYLGDLNNAIVPVRNQLRVNFFEDVAALFKRHKISFRVYPTDDVKTVWDKIYRGFYFSDQHMTLEIGDGKIVCLELQHDWESLYFGLLIYQSNGTKERGTSVSPHEHGELVKKIESKLSEHLPYQIKPIDNVWFAWKEFKVLNKAISFGSDDLNYDFSLNAHKIVEQFEAEMIPYINVWKLICEQEKKEFSQLNESTQLSESRG